MPLPTISVRCWTSAALVGASPFLVIRRLCFSCSRLSVCVEALAELQSLQEVATDLADFVHAPAGQAQDCLLGVREAIRGAVERGVRHGAVVALAMAEAHTDANLTGMEGFPSGQRLEDNADLLPEYGAAVDAVLALVPAAQVLDEDL